MNDDELAQQLMATFLDELHVHVTSIGSELLTLENHLTQKERSAAWTSIFRSAHSLKGASAVVNIDPIHVACHRLEDIFEVYRDSDRSLSEETTSILLQVVDAIEEMGMRIRAEQELEDAPLIDMLPQLEQLASQVSGSPVPKRDGNADVTASPADDDGEFDFDFDPGPETPVADTSETSPAVPPETPRINEALLPVFLGELEERCASITHDAIAMETTSDTDDRAALLTSLFRSAHSLKGAAGVVKIDVVRDLCHRLEDGLDEIRSGNRDFTTRTATALLETVDVIRDVANRLQGGRDFDNEPIQAKTMRIVELLASSESVTPQPTADADANGDEPAGETSVRTGQRNSATASPATDATQPASKRVNADQGPTIRVPAQKLDALLSHTGELLVARGRLAFRAKDAATVRDLAADLRSVWRENERSMRKMGLPTFPKRDLGKPGRLASVVEQTASRLNALSSRLESLASGMDSDNRLLQQTCGLLDDEVYHVRMLPFSDACGGLQRAVRDIATSSNKSIKLKIVGAEIEVDRSVLEGLKDPLLHLVRNSADHGIESPRRREELRKPPLATITVAAELRGGQVEVRVEDDGGGLDLKRICDLARKREIEIPDDPREQARLIFAAGFSTAKMITDISGRGVGLDVVQSQVESLHGSVDVSFKVNEGTRFSLTVPLTLTTIRSMLVVVADQAYAIPTSAIQRLVRFGQADLKSSAGRECLLLGDAPTPVVTLAQTLRIPSKRLLAGESKKGLAIVLNVGEQRVAVVVDEVLTEQEILVKNLGSRVRRLRNFSGCTLLPTGDVALVVNSANVVRTALGLKFDQASVARSGNKTAVNVRVDRVPIGKKLLLAEDSVTTRVLLKNILESAGYAVVTAADGQQAWELMQEQSFDVLVTDVDMPRMDGFDLTATLREVEAYSELPVVLVTARGSDADKERGVQVGANAYIVKGNFEQQNLLDTVAQLV